MRACLIFICLLAATFGSSVKGKAHVKHHGLRKTSHGDKEKDAMTEEINKAQILPTLVTYEASSQEQEDEGMSSQENTNKEGGSTKSEKKSSAVLMSEEELEALVKKDTDDPEELEDSETDDTKPLVKEEEETVEDAEYQVKEIVEKTEVKETEQSQAEQQALFEETEASTESEIPVDLDYASDSSILQPVKILPAEVSEKDSHENDYEQNTEAMHNEDLKLTDEKLDKNQQAKSVEINNDKKEIKNVDIVSQDSAAEAEKDMTAEGEEEEKSKNDSGIQSKKKPRKQKKNQRARKHSPQSDEAQTGTEQSQQDPPNSEGNSTDSGVHKTKRRRAGKWGPLVGVNPVQIRATVDLYPSSRAALSGVTHDLEAPADPCDNFRCKRGKTCKLDEDNKPSCVCQVPSECPPSVNEFDHVCGTDNKTYDTSCELFATKCNLEGTKKGHRLHLDYTGSCKLIPQCLDTELVQFPLRMRDWLKNVLLQLYEHDSITPGFLTPKQHFRVKKIFESEKRLHAGDHTVELLAQDFEKNYNMYIYPVHWQFAQLDQHPSDRQLSHSELAPLRVPLVPMEHCTSLFFQECDADKDKQVSFKEWTSCFGIREEDMDTSLLF